MVKLLSKTDADGANGILRNTKIAVSLKHVSNYWRSREIQLISCNAELKLKWTNYCVLSAAGVDNADACFNNAIFNIKDTKLYVYVVTLSAKDYQNLLKLLSKGSERSVYWNEYKIKS